MNRWMKTHLSLSESSTAQMKSPTKPTSNNSVPANIHHHSHLASHAKGNHHKISKDTEALLQARDLAEIKLEQEHAHPHAQQSTVIPTEDDMFAASGEGLFKGDNQMVNLDHVFCSPESYQLTILGE